MELNRILIVILIICNLTTTAQDQVFELHPVLGDTIDRNEIGKYYLFTDYALDSVDYLVLYKSEDLFTLVGISDSIRTLKRQLSNDEIIFQQEQIEKLNRYYTSVLKKDSSDLYRYKNKPLNADSLSIKDINLDIMTPEFLKSVKKDNRRKYWEEYRKESRKNIERGMMY